MKYAKWISAVVLLLIPLAAVAQLSKTESVAAQVPFKFIVGNATVPAGEISIQLADEKGWVLAISNRDNRRSMYTLAVQSEGRKADATSLVFRKYGDRYFLASVQVRDSRAVYELQAGKLESEMRAQNVTQAEEVSIGGTR